MAGQLARYRYTAAFLSFLVLSALLSWWHPTRGIGLTLLVSAGIAIFSVEVRLLLNKGGR